MFKLISSSEVWVSSAPYYALIVLVLSAFTSHIVFEPMIKNIGRRVSDRTKSDIVDAQLYLRLVSGTPLKKWEPHSLSDAAKKQIPAVVENARLRSFVFMAITGLAFVTISVVRLVIKSIVTIFYEMASLDLIQRPIQWGALKTELKDLIAPFEKNIRNTVIDQFRNVQTHPIGILPKASLFISLFGMALLPSLERRHAGTRVPREDAAATTEMGAGSAALRDDYSNANIVSNMGTSSSSRMFVQNHDGAVENILKRWKGMQSRANSLASSRPVAPNAFILRKLGYGILYSALLLLPLVIHIAFTDTVMLGKSVVTWDQCINIGLLLLFTQNISRNAISALLESSKGTPSVASFLQSLAVTVDEVDNLKQNPKADRLIASEIQIPTFILKMRNRHWSPLCLLKRIIHFQSQFLLRALVVKIS